MSQEVRDRAELNNSRVWRLEQPQYPFHQRRVKGEFPADADVAGIGVSG
jgi:hypothetical protein